MVLTPHTSLIHKVFLSGLALALLSFMSIRLTTENALPVEVCDNALDDDNDGLIDLNDPDCMCEILAPVSLIPNASFEDMECCPGARAQLECASVWIQASEPTTDYIHMCGYMGWPEFPPPLPFPDGEGIVGFRDGRVINSNDPERNWKEYTGACLLGPLEKDSTYRIEFDIGFVNPASSPPINITFFGTSDCANLPFGIGNNDFGCPTNGPGWLRLGSVLVSGGAGNKWVKSSIELNPSQDITAIAIGPDCAPVPNPVHTYYFFDNLLLADARSFELRLTEVSHPCKEDFRLRVPASAEFSYQWYKEGIALLGETAAQISRMYGEGNYQVRIFDGESCRVSTNYAHDIPVYSEYVTKTICKEEVYPFGDLLLDQPGQYVDTVKTEDNCDKVVFLNLNVLGILADTVATHIFEGENYQIDDQSFRQEGDFLVQLSSEQGCDSLVLLQLAYYHIFIPNVFSPNFDGINDRFQIYDRDDQIEVRDLSIYDRWGALVYRGEAWDGLQGGNAVNPGMYTYVTKLRMDDGKERQFSGSVLLLR